MGRWREYRPVSYKPQKAPLQQAFQKANGWCSPVYDEKGDFFSENGYALWKTRFSDIRALSHLFIC